MPKLAGFSDNAFQTRADVVRAAEALLQPLVPYFSPGKARIKVPIASGAHFDETAAQLEGYARPLWLVGALLSAPGSESIATPILQNWIDGLANGINPDHEEFWGAIGDWDQRMVEAEILSFALLSAPDKMYEPLSDESKAHLVEWLKGLNEKVMPENNWRWFRVLSNLALIKVCGVEQEQLWPFVEQDLATLESFYICEGWSSDGVWRPVEGDPEKEGTGENAVRGRHADYYSGSFAIHFSQMLYAKHAAELDPKRAELFRGRAKQFARTFWAYFDTDGAAIPFGRSLTYKFAIGGFYAAFAYAGLCDDSDPFCSYSAIKGMLLRHLRWWAEHSENIFWTDGTLNIGYLYPNMYVSEHYNSPQSSYWAVKSLIVIALTQNDPFWTAGAAAHPLEQEAVKGREVVAVKAAKQVICHHSKASHHFMLSSGQFCVWSMKATEAKYAKFAYSSAFAFSVPTGPSLSQIAPDSTLALSRDEGETWAVRWKTIGDTSFIQVPIGSDSSTGETATTLVSRWKPWRCENMEIETTLVAPCNSWPDWHVRVHQIRCRKDVTVKSIVAVEGGFSINGEAKADGRLIKPLRASHEASAFNQSEAAIESSNESLILSQAGASGVVCLSDMSTVSGKVTGEVLTPDPNTNLVARRTLLPTIKHSTCVQEQQRITLAMGVFAISFSHETVTPQEIQRRWSLRPSLTFAADGQWMLN